MGFLACSLHSTFWNANFCPSLRHPHRHPHHRLHRHYRRHHPHNPTTFITILTTPPLYHHHPHHTTTFIAIIIVITITIWMALTAVRRRYPYRVFNSHGKGLLPRRTRRLGHGEIPLDITYNSTVTAEVLISHFTACLIYFFRVFYHHVTARDNVTRDGLGL